MQPSDFDPDIQNRQIESKIIVALERISQAFRVLLWQESKDFSLSPTQVQVLIFLLHHSPDKRKVSYLADELNMTRATISDTIKTLAGKGLVHRETEPDDSRSYVIHLTDKGRETAKRTSVFSEQIRIPVDRMHPDDKANLLLSLFDIMQHLNSSGVITIQRMCHTCTWYRYDENAKTHYCKLLKMSLKPVDLRVDCPEHESA
jgi:DNA-binding MarR family transcriptional regulator